MKISEAIQKAVENGWKGPTIRSSDGTTWKPDNELLLDPLFWQALGRGMGWNLVDKFDNGKPTKWSYVDGYYMKQMYVFENTPEYHWHRLIDHLSEGKSIEDYFETIGKL